MKIKILETLRSKLGRWLLTEVPQSHGAVFDLKISENNKKWLRANYPDLEIGRDRDGYIEIKGILIFDMVLADDGRSYVIKPGPQHLLSGKRIQDKYKIKIVFKTSEHSNLPQVYEEGGRVKSVSLAKNRKLEDLHMNPSGAACLCLNTEEKEQLPNGFYLPDFFHNLVIPFFYGQAFFENNGVWPCEEYNHAICGLLEGYLKRDNAIEEEVRKFLDHLRKRNDWSLIQTRLALKEEVKGNQLCICGSQKYFRNCHKKTFRGLWKLKQDIVNFHIEV